MEYLHEFDEAISRNREIATLLNKTQVSLPLAEGVTSNLKKYIGLCFLCWSCLHLLVDSGAGNDYFNYNN